MLTIGTQHVFAPRECGGCEEFIQRTDQFISDFSSVVSPDSLKPLLKLTHEFEKDVLKALDTGKTDKVTPDEFEAAFQVLDDGAQEIVLDYTRDVCSILRC
jgi:hypothetical protein